MKRPIDNSIFICHSKDGKIDESLRSKLFGSDLSVLERLDHPNSLIAFGKKVRRDNRRKTVERLLVGNHVNFEPTAELSYDSFKTLVGACIAVEIGDEITVYTDPFNKLLLYRTTDCGVTYISNNLPLLLSIVDKTFKPNINQLVHHLIHSIPFNDDTLLEDVTYLPPHAVYQVSSEYCCSYLPDDFFVSEDKNIGERKDQIFSSLKFNLDAITSHFNKSLLPLTAGNDSRVMLAILSNVNSLGSITWGDEASDDVIVARILAKQASVEHSVISLDELKDGVISLIRNRRDIVLSLLLGGKLKHTFLLNEAMKEIAHRNSYEVEINGVGGELVRAFYYKRIKTSDRLSFYRDNQHSSRVATLSDLNIFSQEEIKNYFEWYAQGIEETPHTKILTDDEYSEFMVHEYRFCRAWSPRYNASKLNRIESMYPFLNLSILENSYKLPLEYKIRNRVLVDMLRKSKKQFLRIPINNVDHSLLGKIKYKLTGRRKNPQSTSTIANSLLHDAFIEEYMKSILHNLSDNSDRIDSNHIDLVYGKMQSNLKSQLVFRVLFSFDYIQRLCKTV